MAVRKLEYTVGIDGITPSTELFAGTEGDIKATEVFFTLDDTIKHLAGKENIKYRFDCYDAEGNVLRGDSAPIESEKVSFVLPESLTRHGGRICVFLVITESEDIETKMELYNFPARMRLNTRPSGSNMDKEEYESFTTLAESAKNSADKAKTEVAKLFGDNVFIFDGGNASDDDAVPIPVTTNKVYNPEDEDEKKAFLSKYPITSGGVYVLLNALYPVGAVITFHDDIDHTDHLGFKWERFAAGRTLLGNGTYTDKNKEERTFNIEDKDDGEYRHKLTEEEMPSHKHVGMTWAGNDEMPVSFGTGGTKYEKGYSLTWDQDKVLEKDFDFHTNETGNGNPHNNLPPYIVTSFWKRIE